ncbi:hypothetical protein EZV73_27065 [Acidaminobacter sp. JC074]|uniref:ATP-binding protein n=1 Tax=Acidaminobacter sp. JC074 TaxID=2530199 RepID=UPI001F0DC294|nr:ATP-binding protein [Acidaminobacter sp. JC074]MCH4891260.1 hypothetical protein [Acidaminobacter sp. JC074]
MKKNRNHLVLLVVLATTILGQLYMKPFGTDFRVSLGIIALSVLLLRFNKIPIVLTCTLTGLSIFVFRMVLDVVPQTHSLVDLLIAHYPSVVFYLFFGLFFKLLNAREVVSKPVVCLVIIALSDVGANTIELIVRGEFRVVSPELLSISIVLTGIIRATISYLLYLSEKVYYLIIINKEQREKYKEFVMMRANIKSEIFFMQKSMDDIEQSMKESFALYRKLNQPDLHLDQPDIIDMRNRILGISKGIHEVKKDYARIIAGIGNVIPDQGFSKYKDSDEVFEILQDVTDKYIAKTGKKIVFELDNEETFPIFYYSPLLSVLNNLIVNAIDAIRDEGWVRVSVEMDDDMIDFYVTDNGTGIKEKHLGAIFTPGFSTKFDKATGKMSTGIGLTHVKQIVERSLDGQIDVESIAGNYTQFHIRVAKKVLCDGGNSE